MAKLSGVLDDNFFGADLNRLSLVNFNETFDQYKRVLVICRKSNSDPIHILVTGSKKLLKNEHHCSNAKIMTRDELANLQTNNIELNDTELVISLTEFTENDIRDYSSLYVNTNDLDNIMKLLVLYDYNHCNTYNGPLKKKLSQIFRSAKETEYWTDEKHCNMSITAEYLKRTFKCLTKTLKTKDQNKDNNNTVKSFLENTNTRNTDYLQHIHRKERFVDGAVAAGYNKDQKIRYKLGKNPSGESLVNRDNITTLFSTTPTERELYDLFNMFLISKKYWHLVLNNCQVLETMSGTIKKFMPLYKYLMGYAWISAYLEECILGTKCTKKDRHVFDINTANKLPFFPYCQDDVHMNPYVSLLVDTKELDPKNNCLGLAMVKDYQHYGIDTLENFGKKFNVFATGNSTQSLFEGLEKDASGRFLHFAFCGSLILACSEKRNPLSCQFGIETLTFDEAFNRHLNEYYSESDIDMMCDDSSTFGFMDKVQTLIKVVEANMVKIAKENGVIASNESDASKFSKTEKDIKESIKLDLLRDLKIIINVKYVKECAEIDDYDQKYIIDNLDSNEIREIFYQKYVLTKLKNNKTQRAGITNKTNLSFYEHFFKMCSPDDLKIELSTSITPDTTNENSTYIYLNDIRDENNKVPEEENIVIMCIWEGMRIKIKSSFLKRGIEVFKVKNGEYFTCIPKFHFGCVRGYYDGENVYMLPSLITALMTYLNIDQKYFASIRDPVEIINKYRMRGYGMFLNSAEKAYMDEFNCKSEKWKSLLSIDEKDKQTITNSYGSKKVTDKLFKPNMVCNALPADTYKDPKFNYILSVEDLTNAYKSYGYDTTKSPLNLLQFKTIKSDGTINPFQPWVLDAAYNILK